MTTDRDKDYEDPPRTTIMKGKGDLEREYKEELYLLAIGYFNPINIPQISLILAVYLFWPRTNMNT